MFLDDPKTRKALTKWAVGTVAACILIFLGVRYISSIALAIKWLVSLVKPLLIGAMLATGMKAYDAARLGVWLHGAAGESVPMRGLQADDLPERIRNIMGKASPIC